jgi:hypothetical protein
MKVKLAEGRALRDPLTKTLMKPDEVRDVPNSMYWIRRVRDGDVVVVEEQERRVAQEGGR